MIGSLSKGKARSLKSAYSLIHLFTMAWYVVVALACVVLGLDLWVVSLVTLYCKRAAETIPYKLKSPLRDKDRYPSIKQSQVRLATES